MNELDDYFARARKETESLQAPKALVQGVLEGVRSRAAQPPQVFGPLSGVGEGRRISWRWLALLALMAGAALWVGVGADGVQETPIETEVGAEGSARTPAQEQREGTPRSWSVPRALVLIGGKAAGKDALQPSSTPSVPDELRSGAVSPDPTPAAMPSTSAPSATELVKPRSVAPVEAVAQAPMTELAGKAAFPSLLFARAIDGQWLQLGNRLVLIHVVSTHCAECFAGVSELKRIAKLTGVVIVGIADDDSTELAAAAKQYAYPFPLIADPQRRLLAQFPEGRRPMHVVVDRQGFFFRETTTSSIAFDDIQAAIRFADTPHVVSRVVRAVPLEGLCSIEGQVERKGDSMPVVAATLTFGLKGPATDPDFSSGTLKATTDAQGHYVLTDVACTTFLGRASMPGVSPIDFEVRALPSGAIAPLVVVPGVGSVSGTVYDAHRFVIAGATVSECVDSPTSPRIETVADERGQFTLSGVNAGPLRCLVATIKGQEAVGVGCVAVQEQQLANVRVEVRAAKIKGTVTGLKARGALFVRAEPGWNCNQLSPTKPIRRDGSFELTVFPGKYRVGFHDPFSRSLGRMQTIQAVEDRTAHVELTDDRP